MTYPSPPSTSPLLASTELCPVCLPLLCAACAEAAQVGSSIPSFCARVGRIPLVLGGKISEIKFDGTDRSRMDIHGGTNSFDNATRTGTFTWAATPASHSFRNHPIAKNGNGDQFYFTDEVEVMTSAWQRTRFSHRGIFLSEQEIDRIGWMSTSPHSTPSCVTARTELGKSWAQLGHGAHLRRKFPSPRRRACVPRRAPSAHR